MTLQDLQNLFPSKTPSAFTGHIPIEWANSHNEEIKQICKDNKLRRVFRGPRQSARFYSGGRSFGATLKKDATAIALYQRSKTMAEWRKENGL